MRRVPEPGPEMSMSMSRITYICIRVAFLVRLHHSQHCSPGPSVLVFLLPHPVPSCGAFAACCMLLSCSIASFAYVSAHAPRGTETTLHLAKPGCTWWPRPLDCLDLRFKSVALDAPSPPPPSRGACTGPLVAHLYHMHRGNDAIVDLAEAHALSSTIRQHTDQSSLCGTAASVGAKPHACFAASTATGRLERAKIGRFIDCLVEHEPADCRGELCG